MKTTTAPASTPATDPTDTTDTPHWHLTTAQATSNFTATHAGTPYEDWQTADFDTYQNLRLAI